MSDTVTVEQVDRDAAADYYASMLNTKKYVEVCRTGKKRSELAERFARHRLAAQPGPIAEVVEALARELSLARDEVADTRQSIFESCTIRDDPLTLDDFAKPDIERLDAQLARIDAALARYRAGGDGWMPIETAPKDGREVLLWLGTPWLKIEKARWYAPWMNWQVGIIPADPAREEICGIGSAVPTHWRPIPAPPAGGDEEEK